MEIVRFDVRAGEAEVSLYLVPDHQGEGFGSELLFAAEQWLAEFRSEVLVIKAEVLGSNQPSHVFFLHRWISTTLCSIYQEGSSSVSKPIRIADRFIGSDQAPFVIAEMSGNHNQSLDRALEIVEAAAKAARMR